jgi:malonyl-CoA/methylmalonyl-CoA synthetase
VPRSTIDIVARAEAHGDRVAVVTRDSQTTYRDLVEGSARIASVLLGARDDLAEARVAFLTTPGPAYVMAQWGVWCAGGIAVPLATSHPIAELERAVRDCTPEYLIYDSAFASHAVELGTGCGVPVLDVATMLEAAAGTQPAVSVDRAAMIIYTSGTTGRPKGVVSTHRGIAAQTTSLVEAWEWSSDDRALLVLPLHHVHGVINVATCALWAGATLDVRVPFDGRETWDALTTGDMSVFMAVPTIYRRLIEAWEQMTVQDRERASAACRTMRLFVSGSAALPVRVLERWKEITGHTLLERYGTTETGMILSNPLYGTRRAGYVGAPLPGVEVQLRSVESAEAGAGEIVVRGDTVFREYWNRPEETAAAFDDGWYRTGDIATVDDGVYRIIGRESVDIVKTGGHKVSALEIEEVLRDHPAVGECAVVGVPDDEWGERVCVAMEGTDDATASVEEIRLWAKERLAPYKVPRSFKRVDALPRNAMGKVVKRDVQKLFAGDA